MSHQCGVKFCRIRMVKLDTDGGISFYCICSSCGMTTGYRDTEQEAIKLWLDGDVVYHFAPGYETLVKEKGWGE